MQKIILSPPFCNLRIFSLFKGATRIVGSYTLEKRPGLYRVFTRLSKVKHGYINDVGLRNPGIVKCKNRADIVSIAALKPGDWDLLLDVLETKDKLIGVEFNISCPNAAVLSLSKSVLARANKMFDYVIVKVPHLISESELDFLLELGDFILHISNTKKVERGGLSGRSLIARNVKYIKYVKEYYPNRQIIAGGGIYDFSVLKVYMRAGADYFSLSTILLNIYKTYKLIKKFKSFKY